MCDQEVESCDFGHEDCSAARVQEKVADVVGADCWCFADLPGTLLHTKLWRPRASTRKP